MTIALLAPGQGSRDLVFVIEFVQKLAQGKELLECAAAAADLPAKRFLEHGGRNLESTQVLQPVLTAISLALAFELSSRGIRFEFVAGHSLGEMAAWATAECISATDAIQLAALRGRLMAREAARRPGGLVALVEEPDVERALAVGRAAGWVEFGAENAPDEIVLSGDDAALRAIAKVCPSRRLSVAGAWHSSAMANAVDEFRQALLGVRRFPARAKLVLNRDGLVVQDENQVPHWLAEQLTRPVRWRTTLETLHHAGVRDFVTVGPGSILRALVRKNLGNDVRVWSTDGESHLRATVEALNGS
jgi:[acyl-carrier-protein] S-malonyltransferase